MKTGLKREREGGETTRHTLRLVNGWQKILKRNKKKCKIIKNYKIMEIVESCDHQAKKETQSIKEVVK